MIRFWWRLAGFIIGWLIGWLIAAWIGGCAPQPEQVWKATIHREGNHVRVELDPPIVLPPRSTLHLKLPADPQDGEVIELRGPDVEIVPWEADADE